MKQITVEIKQIYGNKRIYPACEQSHIFASIAGSKTLTEHTIQQVLKLGYKIYTKPLSL